MDISEIRRRNLLTLVDAEGKKGGQRGAKARFASAIGRAPDLITRWTDNKPVGSDIARHIETCLRLPSGWMDQRHDAPPEPRQPAESGDRLRIALIQYISSAPVTTVAEIARILHLPLHDDLHGLHRVEKLTDYSEK